MSKPKSEETTTRKDIKSKKKKKKRNLANLDRSRTYENEKDLDRPEIIKTGNGNETIAERSAWREKRNISQTRAHSSRYPISRTISHETVLTFTRRSKFSHIFFPSSFPF